MRRYQSFPPYQLLEDPAVADATHKTARLERLYHLTQQHSWDGKATLAALIEEHGAPGKDLPERTRVALARVLGTLLWGELAAWNISADLALEIDDVDAKMAATAQVFDEARHFTVLRDYLAALGPVPQLGGLPRRLLRKVLEAPTLATKLIGMQLLFETNAVVIFRHLEESRVCPVLSGILPYFERDESRHVGLGVLYVPRLIEQMSTAEARRTSRFQAECTLLLMACGFTVREEFQVLGLNSRQMATRVTAMQDDVVRQMQERHGRSVLRAVFTPRGKGSGKIIDLLHPEGGHEQSPPWLRGLNRGVTRALQRVDQALA